MHTIERYLPVLRERPRRAVVGTIQPMRSPDLPSPSSVEVGSDPELLALPKPKRPARTLSLVLMAVTAVLALAMCWALRGEVRYAWASAEPVDVGDLSKLAPGPDLADAFVHGTAKLGHEGAIAYPRFLEPDTFQVAPVVGNPRLWIELRQTGSDPAQAIPQTSFVGRLVPLASAGLQYRGLAARIQERSNLLPQDAWLLVEGRAPASSRWALALTLVLLLFAGWNLVQLLRLSRPIHE